MSIAKWRPMKVKFKTNIAQMCYVNSHHLCKRRDFCLFVIRLPAWCLPTCLLAGWLTKRQNAEEKLADLHIIALYHLGWLCILDNNMKMMKTHTLGRESIELKEDLIKPCACEWWSDRAVNWVIGLHYNQHNTSSCLNYYTRDVLHQIRCRGLGCEARA